MLNDFVNVPEIGEDVQLDSRWYEILAPEFKKTYMAELSSFLVKEREQGKVIYPKQQDIFRALNNVPFERVRVVILGQDPYHGDGQAHGLSFSVPRGVKKPPSLINIFKELSCVIELNCEENGDLTSWAEQGVLLLNSTLTVEAGKAGSHQGKGWEIFTDAIIRILNERQEKVVYMLWGSYAQKKGAIIDDDRNLVLKAPHPSPLSAYRGFLGCGHFVKANAYLVEQGFDPIDWTAI